MNWWAALYDEHVADMFLDAPVEDETRFLWNHLGLDPGSRVLDQCCGTGRLSLALARQGASVLGIDQAPAYIERARHGANGLAAQFEVADAFFYVPDERFNAVFNWWTSFGYEAHDDANFRMLDRARDALHPGGSFALDVPNAPGLFRHFEPATVLRRDGTVLLRESRLDLVGGSLHKTWNWFLSDGRQMRHETRVRLYLPHELHTALAARGFLDIHFYGSVAGDALTLDSPRCIVVARRG
ncbi:MAG TPA: class I SAM-dependent methyltransferase [Candidatus Xenobia bacterium]